MKNITTNTVNTTNDIGMIASLFGCAALSVALLANAFAAPAMPVQKMETIVVTANRLASVTLEPMVITAKRIHNDNMVHVTLAPMVITAQRVTV
jgi:hypothetical protein